MRPSPAMVVALLALFVALGGVGFAAITLPKNSVGPKQLKNGAVTRKKIRANSVGSAQVRNLSLLALDFREGELPAGPKGDKGDQGAPGPTFGAAAVGSSVNPAENPAAAPDEPGPFVVAYGRHFDVTLPESGKIYVRFHAPTWGVTCSVGGPRAGVYLDDAPLAQSGQPLANENGVVPPAEFVTVAAASAGPHSLEVSANCPSGGFISETFEGRPTWTVLLLGG